MERIALLTTIITFSVLIFSGTTLNLSQRIQTKLKSDESTSIKEFTDLMIKVYKILALVGVILYLTTLKLYENRVNLNIATLVLIGYIMKYFYVTSDDSDAYRMSGDFIEHPLSVVLDVFTNLGITIQSIIIIMQL